MDQTGETGRLRALGYCSLGNRIINALHRLKNGKKLEDRHHTCLQSAVQLLENVIKTDRNIPWNLKTSSELLRDAGEFIDAWSKSGVHFPVNHEQFKARLGEYHMFLTIAVVDSKDARYCADLMHELIDIFGTMVRTNEIKSY